jgi:glycosyltransferase involved in cell wall biosynthesis
VSEPKTISIIAPAYNEEGNLEEAHRRITAVMETLPHRHEIIIVDNCSTDRTAQVSEAICARDPRCRYFRFSRNFGAEVSLAAGIRHAQGDAIINVFTDLQDPPEMIPEFVAKWEEGYDVVYGVVSTRSDASWLKQRVAGFAYWLIHVLSDCRIPTHASDFRLITREVADALSQCREQDRYLRGLVHWAGFRQIGVPYERQSRQWGDTKASFWWCVGFALNAVMSFSAAPLRLASYFGLVTCGLSVLLALVYLALWLFLSPPAGWTTIALILLFQIGLQSLFIGIAGEYLARTYQEAKGRPLWIIAKTINMEKVEKVGIRRG